MDTNSKKIMAIACVFGLVISCNSGVVEPKVHKVTLERLIDNAEQYNGKLVQVSGFASMGFENCIFFPYNPEIKEVPEKYWVWYREKDIGCGVGEYARKSKYGNAIIKGRFDWYDKVHLGSLSASINDAEINWIK